MWSYQTTQYKSGQPNTNAMHDAIDATMDRPRAGRTYKSRVDDFGATPLPLKATITSKTFATTVFSFTELGESINGIKYSVTGALEFKDEDSLSDPSSGVWLVHEAQNCEQAVLDNYTTTQDTNDKALGLYLHHTPSANGAGQWTRARNSRAGNLRIDNAMFAEESIVGRTVVVYCEDGTPCGCGVIKRNWLHDDITTSTVTNVGTDFETEIDSADFETEIDSADAFAVGDSRRQRHLASNAAGYSVQTAVACGEYCDELSKLLTNDCLSFKNKMADFGVTASCPKTTAVYTVPTSAPTTIPTATPTAAPSDAPTGSSYGSSYGSHQGSDHGSSYGSHQGSDHGSDSGSDSATTTPTYEPTFTPTTSPTQGQQYDGKVVYKKEFGTLIQQSALEKKYEQATIVLGVFCSVLLVLVIFLVVRWPGSGGGNKEGSPVRGSQLENQLSV
jgi:hypothetical protein